MSRRLSKKTFEQTKVNEHMNKSEVMFNGRNYPVDEYAGAYKDFKEVTRSVELAGLAKSVAMLKPIFVIKDSDESSREG